MTMTADAQTLREIELVLEGAERLRSALAASQEQRRG